LKVQPYRPLATVNLPSRKRPQPNNTDGGLVPPLFV
jgi:hypothetical protein